MAKPHSNPEMAAHGPEVRMGSERSFGLVFTAVFALIGAWPLLGGAEPRIWALGAATAFLAVSLAMPRMLRPLNLLWFKFGLLLHKVVSPLIMGLLFFVTVTPIALIMRAAGKDPLRLKRDPGAESYWIPRRPPGPDGGSMKNQF